LLSGTALKAIAQADNYQDYRVNLAVTGSFSNTQFPFYADNAAGPNLALFYQKTTLFGLQAKAGDYFYDVRFKQVPVTVGYRIGKRYVTRETSPLTGWYPFAYVGAGISHAKDSGTNHLPTASVWDFCMQGSAGVDHQFKYFTWRVAEVSWTATDTPVRSLRSLGVGTGLVFHILH
jgi:hypothetical protein